MPTRKCCCVGNCEIGRDYFDRPDSDAPGPKWAELSGDWDIYDDTVRSVGGSGVLATKLCHPTGYEYGSFIARFDLVDLNVYERFAVRCGHPNNSGYNVEWYPDIATETILVKVNGDENEEFSFPWPRDVGNQLQNRIQVKVCYLPGAIMSATGGPPPSVDACIGKEDAEPCYDIGGQDVGNFSFLEGRFDNWLYEATIIDDLVCPPCGCFCFKRDGDSISFACFPDEMTLTLEMVEGECSELESMEITMQKGQLLPDDGWPEKLNWYSEVMECETTGAKYAFQLGCSNIVRSGDQWFYKLEIRITDENRLPSTQIFEWDGVQGASQDADYDASTCEPLSFVYPGLLVKSIFVPCGAPGEFGYVPFCGCLDYDDAAQCYPSPPTIRFNVYLTE